MENQVEDIRDRIKKLREELGLSQAEFGKKLSLERSAISLIERKQRNATERCIKDICREFQVDYIWLTTGEGDDPFVKSDVSFYEKIDRIMAGENDTLKTLIKKLVDAPEEDIAALKRCIDFCANLKEES